MRPRVVHLRKGKKMWAWRLRQVDEEENRRLQGLGKPAPLPSWESIHVSITA